MLDHITIPVKNIEASKVFYTEPLALIGYEMLAEFSMPEAKIIGFGKDGKPSFWIGEPLGDLPENSSGRPGLVHRIDKDTSGLLVIAKTSEAMTHLARQFFEKSSERQYVALVWGSIEEDEGTIEGPIARNPKNRLQMQVFPEGDQGKEAVTHYKVIERLGYVTLVSCSLETGRTHQIRVHLKYIGHTLFNDERYGGNKILKGTTFTKYKQFVDNAFKILPRQALHAKTLGFIHPVSGKKMRFDSALPEDMAQCIEKWRLYAKHSR